MSLLMMEEQKRLDALRSRAQSCTACEFSQTRTNLVFGEGALGSLIMSVSEAPGKQEDEAGRPYQGKAGNYWEGMIRAGLGLNRTHLYVCNALCCRPPGNSIPSDYHNIHACNVFLMSQISIVQPKILLVFGKVAAYSLGLVKKNQSLSSVTGRHPFSFSNFRGEQCLATAIVTYHPSYLMRQGGDQLKASWESYQHLQEAKWIFDGLALP